MIATFPASLLALHELAATGASRYALDHVQFHASGGTLTVTATNGRVGARAEYAPPDGALDREDWTLLAPAAWLRDAARYFAHRRGVAYPKMPTGHVTMSRVQSVLTLGQDGELVTLPAKAPVARFPNVQALYERTTDECKGMKAGTAIGLNPRLVRMVNDLFQHITGDDSLRHPRWYLDGARDPVQITWHDTAAGLSLHAMIMPIESA